MEAEVIGEDFIKEIELVFSVQMWISEFYESDLDFKGGRDIPRKQNPSRDIVAGVNLSCVGKSGSICRSKGRVLDKCAEQVCLCQIAEGLVGHAGE